MNDIKIRLLRNEDNDYKLLTKWYQQKEIYSMFEQRILNYEEIKTKYYPRTLKSTKVPVYMIEYNNIPVGIIQYKLIDNEDKKIYKLNNDNIYELDSDRFCLERLVGRDFAELKLETLIQFVHALFGVLYFTNTFIVILKSSISF